MDYTALAMAAVGFLKPHLVAAGGKLLEDGLSATREKLLEWLRSKLTKPAQSGALEEATQAPQDDGALEALQLQIRRLAEQNEEFRRELLEHLPKEVVPTQYTQTLNVSGTGNVSVQNAGSGNTINIQR